MLAMDMTYQAQPEKADLKAQALAWLNAVATSQDRDAFANLYRQFAPKVKRYMVRQGADDATADDLAQETMVQLWRKAALYDASKAAPSSWIFTIARNLRIDRLRKQKFYEVELADQHIDAENKESTSDRPADHFDSIRLAEMVECLPPDQAEAVKLSFFEGLTHAEIGQRLGLPLGTVKSRLRLAFGKLRTAIGEQI